MPKEPLRIRLDLKGIEAHRFVSIKDHLGVKNDTEVVRAVLNWYWRQFKNELTPPLEYFNTYEDHITLRDHHIGKYIDIFIRDNQLWCENCESSKCQHIQFALSLPKVSEILKQHGWTL